MKTIKFVFAISSMLVLASCGGSNGVSPFITSGQSFDQSKIESVDQSVKDSLQPTEKTTVTQTINDAGEEVTTVIVEETPGAVKKMNFTGNSSATINVSGQANQTQNTVMSGYLDYVAQEFYLKYQNNSSGVNSTIEEKIRKTEAGYEIIEDKLTSNYAGQVYTQDNMFFNGNTQLAGMYYEQYATMPFSWNAQLDADSAIAAAGGQQYLDTIDESAIKEIYNYIVIAGDPSTGTFDFGLQQGHTFNFDIRGTSLVLKLNAYKLTYKDYLLRSQYTDEEIDVLGTHIKAVANIAYTYNF